MPVCQQIRKIPKTCKNKNETESDPVPFSDSGMFRFALYIIKDNILCFRILNSLCSYIKQDECQLLFLGINIFNIPESLINYFLKQENSSKQNCI